MAMRQLLSTHRDARLGWALQLLFTRATSTVTRTHHTARPSVSSLSLPSAIPAMYGRAAPAIPATSARRTRVFADLDLLMASEDTHG